MVDWSSSPDVWKAALDSSNPDLFVCDAAIARTLGPGRIGRRLALSDDVLLSTLIDADALAKIAQQRHVGRRTLDRQAATVYRRYGVRSRHELLVELALEYLGRK